MRGLPDRSLPSRPTRIFASRLLAAAAVVAFSIGSIVGGAAPAWATKKPVIPSQAEVDKANAAAHAKAVQIGQTEAQLAAANAQLQKLNDQTELVIEKYNGAMAKLAAAQQTADAAQAALTVAKNNRAKAQLQMDQFAAESYRGTSSLDEIGALVTSGSAETALQRAAALGAVSRHQQGIINQMKSALATQQTAQQAASQALKNQQSAAADAAKAKDAAVAATNAQAQQVGQIQQTQSQLQAQLAVLKGKAKNLADARAQGLRELAAEQAAERKAAEEAAKKRAEQATQNGGGGAPTELVKPGTGHSVSTPAQRATAVAFAQSKIGIWYRWAGAGEIGPTVTSSGIQNVEGYDCSGLTMMAYRAAGISLGHYTGLQWDEGMHVSRDQLQPGDLVFFATDTSDISTIHHVGSYIGNGQMIDAPETGRQIGIHNAFRPDYIGAVRP